MTTRSDNELATRVGPGTPMGELMRQYWIPAAMSSELVADGDPVRLMLLGEKLIGFRDSAGRVGVMDHRCPHRCASLFFGRNEEGGLRCVYHGWKFDTAGNCLDMANVPPHQDFRQKVRAKAYRAAERNGLVWVFMGDQANVPELPRIEATMVAEADNEINIFRRDCNWLQAMEGDLDTSHVDFLHGGARTADMFEKDDLRRFGSLHRAPEYEVVDTDWGTMYGAYRPAEEGETYWRVGQFLFPFWSITPSAPFGKQIYARAWVPMDDEHTLAIRTVWKAGRDEGVRNPRRPVVLGFDELEPDTTDWYGRFRLSANAENDYQLDRAAMKTASYSGVTGITQQDQMVTESMGAITDWTFEHLAPSDRMISRTRRRLLAAVKAMRKDGTRPPGADAPDIYFQARGGFFAAREGRKLLDVYWDKLEETRAAPAEFVLAAE